MVKFGEKFNQIRFSSGFKFCPECKAVFRTGRVLSVLGVILDVYTVASMVSWAGKEFGWWKKDYVNDYTIGWLFSLF